MRTIEAQLSGHKIIDDGELVGYVVPSQLSLLIAAGRSGDPGTMRLAAQLVGCAPCETCGYVNTRCHCSPIAHNIGEGDEHA